MPQHDFCNSLLQSIHSTQKVITRLLSRSSFSNLLECDSYLRRYYAYSTGLTSRMTCPRRYRPTIQACKTWALQNCQGICTHERMFLEGRSRQRRTSFMCHAGLFGILWKIYIALGHSCESNHVTQLSMSRSLGVSQSLFRLLNGKIVYLFKTTDTLTTRTNRLSQDLRTIDHTLSVWQAELRKVSAWSKCHESMLFEFLSKHSNAINRAFIALLRLTEIQDVLHQFANSFAAAVTMQTMQSRPPSVIIAYDPSKFRLQLQGTSIRRQLCRPADLMAYASAFFAAHLRSPLRYCSGCCRRHRHTTVCLPTPWFTATSLNIIADLADSTIITTWKSYHVVDFLALANYCLFDKFYIWSHFKAFLPPSFAQEHLDDCIHLLYDLYQYHYSNMVAFFLAFLHCHNGYLRNISLRHLDHLATHQEFAHFIRQELYEVSAEVHTIHTDGSIEDTLDFVLRVRSGRWRGRHFQDDDDDDWWNSP